MKYAADLVQLHIDERIERLRGEALSRGIPVADNETLNYLLLMISATRPKRILEIGTAVGLSAAAMLTRLPETREKLPKGSADAPRHRRKAVEICFSFVHRQRPVR